MKWKADVRDRFEAAFECVINRMDGGEDLGSAVEAVAPDFCPSSKVYRQFAAALTAYVNGTAPQFKVR